MSKPTLLMIENDLPTIEMYRSVLSEDYDVFSHSDESQILEFLQQHTPYAIVVEPALHSGLGWTIFVALHEAIHQHHIPIVICTTSDDRKRGMEMGATAFLVKPVLPNFLLQTLNTLQQDQSMPSTHRYQSSPAAM